MAEETNTETKENLVVTEEQPPVKKKRGRKPSKNKKKFYFGEEEEAAFQQYISSTDDIERNRIFRTILYPAFSKMIESLIRRYTLFTPLEDFSNTFHDTMSFLITKVNNFNPQKKFKAYSYCGTVCKNYLLLQRTQKQKLMEQQASYDALFTGFDKDNRAENDKERKLIMFNTELIDKTIEQIQEMLSPEHIDELSSSEQNVGYALLEMLMHWQDIFQRIETRKFNKTSVSLFIKEYTMLDTNEVRKAMKRYKDLYFFTKQKMIDE